MEADATPSPALLRLKRIGLRTFFGGVAFNALLAIVVILFGGGGETSGKILATSLLLTAASIGVITNAAAHERGMLGPVPAGAGITLVAGFGMAIAGIWAEPEADDYLRVLGTLLVLGIGGSYAGLLSVAHLRRAHRWLQWAAFALTAVFCAVLIGVIWSDIEPIQLLAVLGVLLAAVSIVIPVQARVSLQPARHQPATPVAYCPICGGGVEPSDRPPHRCGHCGSVFSVDVFGE